jgi:hypothetical protein
LAKSDKFRNQAMISTWFTTAVNTCLTHSKKEEGQAKDELTPNIIERKEEEVSGKQEQIQTLYKMHCSVRWNERIIINPWWWMNSISRNCRDIRYIRREFEWNITPH